MSIDLAAAEPGWWGRATTRVRRWLAALCPNALLLKPMDPQFVARLVCVAKKAWPEVVVEDREFTEFLQGKQLDSEEYAADLFLACGCAKGDRQALAKFESDYLSQIPGYIARIGREPAFVQEVLQLLRDRLLVSSPAAPARISDYAGRGPLGGWLRVVAIRAAIELKRVARNDAAAEEESSNRMMASPDPELQYMRVRYAGEFRRAFAEALGGLESRQRTILKLYLVDGLNIERIGKIYDVHRATVARWIQSARDSLYDETRNRLQLELKVTAAEFESLLGVLRSDLDVSVCRLLRDNPSEHEP